MNPIKDKAATSTLRHVRRWICGLTVWRSDAETMHQLRRSGPWEESGSLFLFGHQIQFPDIDQIGRLSGYIEEQDDDFFLIFR